MPSGSKTQFVLQMHCSGPLQNQPAGKDPKEPFTLFSSRVNAVYVCPDNCLSCVKIPQTKTYSSASLSPLQPTFLWRVEDSLLYTVSNLYGLGNLLCFQSISFFYFFFLTKEFSALNVFLNNRFLRPQTSLAEPVLALWQAR